MSASSDDGADPVLRKYAPKWSRERPTATDVERQRYVNLPKEEHQDRHIRTLLTEPVREPPALRKAGLLALVERFESTGSAPSSLEALMTPSYA